MAEKTTEIKKTSFENLPEPIIQHILSFLAEKVATKTSILSKAWLNAWRTKPNLEFKYYQFSQSMGLGSGKKQKEIKKYFSKYINRTLERYTEQKMSIETLDVDAGFFDDYSQVLVQRCALVAVERGVKKLHLFGYSWLPAGVKNLHLVEYSCKFPQIIFEAKSLVDLSLTRFNMLNLSTEKFLWPGLKRLCLLDVSLDEAMFENIISSCPFLEIFEISYNFYGHFDNRDHQFKVIEHHNLKQFTVRLCYNQMLIVAEAPKLESLTYTNRERDWKPCRLSLHSSQYQNLKMLKLFEVGITDHFFNNMEQKFPHLQDLSVLYCEGLRRIKISSQSLQRIKLQEICKLEKAHFDVPSIERLEYVCHACEIIPEFSFGSTATKGRHWISNLTIHWEGNVGSCWFLQLKKLLVNLIPSQIFLKVAILGSVELDMNEVRNSQSFGEPQELQELSLSLSNGVDYSSSSILLAPDAFFSICRPNIISQYSFHDDL